ncbi:unnamed protein product [Amoebophrya sp. A25]|nr:unnamed protein product [Amoebophrya sp. A25]|eukprot:GSA25T00018398001.1
MPSPSVVIVCTSADKFGSDGHATGVWLDELAHPYYMLAAAGMEVTVASLQGGEIPVDAGSRGAAVPDFYTDVAKKFDADEKATERLKNSKKLTELSPDAFDAIYIPGGHGCCADMSDDAALKTFIEKMYADGKPVAACCHGPVALPQCCKPDGTALVSGLKIAVFKDAEEADVGHKDRVTPWLLEAKCRELGADLQQVDNWNSKAVRDGNLFTGQNPQSSVALVELLLDAMKQTA